MFDSWRSADPQLRLLIERACATSITEWEELDLSEAESSHPSVDSFTALIQVVGREVRLGIAQHELGGVDLLDLIGAAAQLQAWAAATVRTLAARVSALRSLHPGDWVEGRVQVTGSAAESIACQLGISHQAAGRLIAEGLMLDGPLAEVDTALRSGLIDTGKAGAFCEALLDQPLEISLAVIDAVLPQAHLLNHHTLRRRLAAAVIAADPEGADAQHTRARANRKVTGVRVRPHGMASLTIYAPLADVLTIDQACETIARTTHSAGDHRTLAQLRADALTTLATHALNGTALTDAGSGEHGSETNIGGGILGGGRRDPMTPARLPSGIPALDVRVTPKRRVTLALNPADLQPARDRVGLAEIYSRDLWGTPPEQHTTPETTGSTNTANTSAASGAERDSSTATVEGLRRTLEVNPPSELLGFGPVPPGEAARLATTPPPWLRTATRPQQPGHDASPTPGRKASGRTDDWEYTAAGYAIPAAMARHVRETHPVCVAHGCAVPSSRCDLDHVIPWPTGPTTPGNLRPLCRRHHRLKTHHHFTLRVEPDGATIWSTPLGQNFHRTPTGHTTRLPSAHALTATGARTATSASTANGTRSAIGASSEPGPFVPTAERRRA